MSGVVTTPVVGSCPLGLFARTSFISCDDVQCPHRRRGRPPQTAPKLKPLPPKAECNSAQLSVVSEEPEQIGVKD